MQFKLHNKAKLTLSHLIQDSFKKVFSKDVTLEVIYSMISTPPRPENGDYAFGCFRMSKELKKSPADIAGQISKALKQKVDGEGQIAEVSPMGPYLNFTLTPKFIMDSFDLSSGIVSRSEKTIIEFSQPNTHKIMHVGHMRNLSLGDALIKIHRFAGIETLSTTFPGDVGTHVAKCLWYLKHRTTQTPPEKRKGAWLGELYSLATLKLEEEKGTAKEEENRKILTQILKEIEHKNGPYYELWKETRTWSIDLMKSIYDWADVEFDSWYWESTVDSDSVELVKKYYNEGLFIKDDGAIGIDLTAEKLGFCLLLKSDGTGLYSTKDIELARRKFEDHQVEKSLYVVDNRQSLHFKQVFKTLEKMGFEKAAQCLHLQYEMVELPSGAMSSRKGNIVGLQDLIDQMQSMIKAEYLQKYKESWSDTKIEETSKKIASAAIKYGMNRVDPNKKIVFDMKEWLKLDGESGPYIQYVYARIQSMLKNSSSEFSPKDANFACLSSSFEKNVMLNLLNFKDHIENALKNYKTNLICNALYDLAKSFNQFYAHCPIAKAQNDELRVARLSLATMTANTLELGLGLLGIKCPSEM